MKHTPGMHEGITVSVHCHDDLGLATANALAGIQAGARQAEVTINGIGERAGNTSLEEVVMTLNTRKAMYGLDTNIETTHISRVSKLVSNYTGIPVQPNKAIVGANAFAHEAGIHQDGMLKHNQTYEIMRPEMVGVSQSRLVLGKHSGRHAFKKRMQDMGYKLDEESIDRLFERFKSLADKKKIITDTDLEALLSDTIYQPREIFALVGLQVVCGTMGMPTATIRLRGPDGKETIHSSVGTGPIDAAYKAIDTVIADYGAKAPARLLEFVIHAVTEGIDAIGEVTVRIVGEDTEKTMDAQSEISQPRTYGGYGADTDIVVASAKAYLSALNKVLVASGLYGPAESESSEVAIP
jgi:2-isopropylmalate synthase